MKSMTGYGYGLFKNDDYCIEIEIKSYNNRYLDTCFSLNPLLSSFESYIQQEIKKVASRGHLDILVKLKVIHSGTTLSLDEALLGEYKNVYNEISRITEQRPSFSDYANIENLIVVEKSSDQSVYQEGVESALSDALKMLEESKERDGIGTKKDLVRLGQNFSNAVDFVYSKSGELENFFKDILLKKFNELVAEFSSDDPRFLSEVAALLVKYSINEEISRLKVHIEEYNRLLSLDEPVGKKLDFLCQEMNRECNTIASKSQLAEINLKVVEMKDNLENIREQIRNIE